MRYKQIVGLDFGHGEISAHCITGDSIDPLRLNAERDTTIMAALAYGDNGRILIGPDVKGLMRVEAYFKASPKHWDEKTRSGHTKKTLMHDFMKQLFDQIRTANAPLGLNFEPETTLLVVGCPTSDEWLGKQNQTAYQDLIRSATGFKHVWVVPESRAAIFSAFDQVQGLTMDTSKGIIVFDFGSSTADCTYYLLAKKRMETNRALGASEIEKAIVEQALSKTSCTVAEDMLTTNELSVRAYKEAYFTTISNGNNYDTSIALDFIKLGTDGQPILLGVSKRTGKPLYDREEVPCRINDITIEQATMLKKFALQDNPLNKLSWYEHCESLFQSVREYLDDHNLPCETIILTGGASKMDFVQTLCKETFPQQNENGRIYIEKNPSYSVSIGLCYLAHGMENMDELMEASRSDREATLKSNVDTMIQNTSEELAQMYFNATCEALDSLNGQVTIGRLTDTVEAKMMSIPKETINAITQKNFDTWEENATTILKENAEQIVQQMYPGLDGVADSRVSNQDLRDALKNMGVSIETNSVMGNIDTVGAFYRTIVNIISWIVCAFVATALSFVPVLNILAGLLAKAIVEGLGTEWLRTNRNRSLNNIGGIAQRYKNDAAKNIQSLTDDIKKKLKEVMTKQMGADYSEYLKKANQAAKATVEIMSLQRFDGSKEQ